MKTIKIYTNRCLTCDEGDRVRKVKAFAKENGYEYMMRRTDLDQGLKKEALVFGAPMPFIELEGKTLDFFTISVNPTIKDEQLEEMK